MLCTTRPPLAAALFMLPAALLPPPQTASIARAPGGASIDRRAGSERWSLEPVRKSEVTTPAGTSPARTPIDAFLLERLAAAGLSLSEPADRATYIRRVTFDLHGLPPTFEEVQEFVNDSRPDAYERLVERLLASPRYGERWGRHWLDVVRFAESNGFERDRIRPNFWRYRDYVIDAFNRDLPYDQFVREQLAGDALRPGDPQALVATGFLVAGPKNDVSTISELEQLTTRQDELDEFVVATGTTFLGLTVGCARCHDHKFDPIRSTDYYSLAAVFSGLDRGDNVLATDDEQARHAAAVSEVERRIGEARAPIKRLIDQVRDRLRSERLAAAPGQGGKLPMIAIDRNDDVFEPVAARFVRFAITATNTGTEPCIDELEIYGDDPQQNLALATSGAKASASSLLPGYPIHQIDHLNDGRHGNPRSWISNEPGKGWAQIELPQATTIRRVAWGRDREAKYTDRIAIGYRIEVSIDSNEWTTVSTSERRVAFEKATTAADQIPQGELLAALTPAERAEHERLAAELSRVEAELKAIPPLPAGYSVRDNPPRDTFVLKRGNVRDRGERVDPAALAAIAAIDRNLLPAENDSGPERRRRLAEWIVDVRNPLTARVFVNRVWHYHFGAGLVRTPSDFGASGDRPSHPDLLDWLAADFVGHGWRLKRLHRLIVLSAAYRQSSDDNAAAAATDADNRLLWRMNPRRLEAEALRDAILHTAGNLDLPLGGPSFRLFEYRDGNVPDYVLTDAAGPETWRRGVYMFNIRTFHEPLMSVFDCPDPSVQTPRREASTTALQALSLMNNRFAFEHAEHFARRVETRVGRGADADVKVREAYRLAFGRLPDSQETQQAVQFVAAHGLFSLCRVLLNANEFLYVR